MLRSCFGAQLVVEDDEPDLILLHILTYLLELALADEGHRVRLLQTLDKAHDGANPCRTG